MTTRFAATLVAAMAIATFMAAGPGDSAVISNSGSTNAYGYTITVTPDGKATVAMQAKGAAPSAAKPFTVPSATITKFFDDLAAARKANIASVPCMKSVSFGSGRDGSRRISIVRPRTTWGPRSSTTSRQFAKPPGFRRRR